MAIMRARGVYEKKTGDENEREREKKVDGECEAEWFEDGTREHSVKYNRTQSEEE